MKTEAIPRSPWPADESAECRPLPRPGVVAGTVLRAARLSAHLGQAQLAAASDVREAAIVAWEDGAESFAEVGYSLTVRVEAALATAGADPTLVADVASGAWCDLVFGAVGEPADLRCLLADPVADERAFGELLTWAVGGDRPTRYRPYAPQGTLLDHDDRLLARAVWSMHEAGWRPERRAA